MIKVYRYEIETTNKDTYPHNPGPYNADNIFKDKDMPEFFYTNGKRVKNNSVPEKYWKYQKLCHKMLLSHTFGTHPCVRIDISNFIPYINFCACPNIKTLRQWFKGFNASLLKLGFNLVEYEVKEVLIGESGRQCAFKLDNIVSRKVLK